MQSDYDVIVIGGGHAGAEAAWAASRLGARTALVTFDRAAIGRMSCNPAIGGIGKGQMVREIDALGGLMGLVADETAIQFRMLNRRKGPAMWAPRAQSDMQAYATAIRERLEQCENLTIIEAGVEEIDAAEIPENEQTDGGPAFVVRGAKLTDERMLRAPVAIVTSGTFLNGLMHTGTQRTAGGRIGEAAAVGLSGSLARLGLRLGRLKTGTPPRVHRDSIDYSSLAKQPGDAVPAPFSFMNASIQCEQVPCWITFTNPQVHELIRANLDRAPMYTGQIESEGPRYCPSIETKIVRFGDKPQHQIFLEPEGRESDRIYLNGVSTSLPEEVQREVLALIPGLEHAQILQVGYAIEYDFVPPEQISLSLMTKRVRGLFLAGQVNGTSGYEEAAAQGLLAGVNGTCFISGREPLTLGRDQAYIGVMVDDLVTRGITEPYRMFTSRAEHRMILRYDNADARLTPIGRQVGLVDQTRWERYEHKARRTNELFTKLDTLRDRGKTARQWLKHPEDDGSAVLARFPDLQPFAEEADVWAAAVTEVKYAGYIQRQQRAIAEFHELEDRPIPAGINYGKIMHLRFEAVERWSVVRPANVGQAARVSGIHPTDVTVLLVELARRERSSS